MMTQVTVGNETRTCRTVDAIAVAEEMGASPDNRPTFQQVNATSDDGKHKGTEGFSAEGQARSVSDRIGAESAGYATAGTVYERGSKVNSTGVTNAREKAQEFANYRPTSEGLATLIDQVKAEDRKDTVSLATSSLRMTDAGLLCFTAPGVTTPSEARYSPTARATRGLLSRLGCGGADYLMNACSPKLRAINVNHQAVALGEAEQASADAWKPAHYRDTAPDFYSRSVLRTRAKGEGREAYAVVSPSYSPFDADKVAQIVAAGISPDCRGPVTYDGQRVRIEALLHTTVQPENFVAGEFFRAGIVCDSDDTGAGGIRIRGVVFQNLCLNLIILDEAWQSFGSVIHKGSPRGMVSKVREALAKAVASLEHFRKAWGYAAVTPATTQEQTNLGREISALALFRGILNRELVKVPGKVEENAAHLVRLWSGDESSATQEVELSKAAVVNAFTALAHDRDDLDVWQADDIGAQASRLLLRKQPLPFELIETA